MVSSVPPLSPVLSVCTPLPDVVTTLLVNDVPREWLAEIASLACDTTLLATVPLLRKLKIPIEATSPCTLSTVSFVKVKVPPLEA